jgi:hypothetical protein
MDSIFLNGLTIWHDRENPETVELFRAACEKSVRLLRTRWDLPPPPVCRVYIMASWRQFFLHSPPWPWKILLAASVPFWIFRIRAMWPFIGGWEQSYGRRHAVGVKPPRLMESADRSIGRRIFVAEEDVREKVRRVICHELTHAFTADLGLPVWLKEGLAMTAVDHFAGKTTVRRDTLRLLENPSGHAPSAGSEKIRVQQPDEVIRLYARGYWLTRYVEETQPDTMKEILRRRRSRMEVEELLATAYRQSRREFLRDIHSAVRRHFADEAR